MAQEFEDDLPTRLPEPIRWTRAEQLAWAAELMALTGIQLEPPDGRTRTTLELYADLPTLHPDKDQRELEEL